MPEQPHWTSSHTLSKEQSEAYLERILLDKKLITSQPSLALLSQLLLAQVENVPKDTTPLHVPSWNVPDDTPIILASNSRMPLGVAAYDRIVNKNSGAFCFALNPTFAALLRYFGFRVSEMASRCYQALGNDPKVHPLGYKWGTLSHQCLVVDWPESKEGIRYLVDTGFGGGNCSIPVPLIDGTVIKGLGDFEAYKLTFGPLPSSPSTPVPIDSLPGWTLERRVSGEGNKIILPIDSNSPGFWSPLFHFLPISITLIDFDCLNWYSQGHANAAFYGLLLVTKVLANTGGARRSLMFSKKNQDAGELLAKIHTTGGNDSNGSTDERDVEFIEMKVGPMKNHLKEEWGFNFN